MLAGLHAAFLLFHNNAVDLVRLENPSVSDDDAFAEARRLTTYHYQWLILKEFLPLFVGQAMVDDILANGRRFYTPRYDEAFIPVEFQIVYRIGHSMVRPSYRANLAGDHGNPFFGMVFDPAGEGSLGVVAGHPTVVEWLRQLGRPFLFSSAMTVPDACACLAAVDILEESTALVDQLWENTRYFKAEMVRLGYDIGKSVTPITPVILGEAPLAQQFSRELFEQGVFAMAIGFPTVPRCKARIRVMISAAHQRDDLDRGLEIFGRVGRKLGVLS